MQLWAHVGCLHMPVVIQLNLPQQNGDAIGFFLYFLEASPCTQMKNQFMPTQYFSSLPLSLLVLLVIGT